MKTHKIDSPESTTQTFKMDNTKVVWDSNVMEMQLAKDYEFWTKKEQDALIKAIKKEHDARMQEIDSLKNEHDARMDVLTQEINALIKAKKERDARMDVLTQEIDVFNKEHNARMQRYNVLIKKKRLRNDIGFSSFKQSCCLL